MKRITQFILCLVLAVSAFGQGVGGNSVPRTVSGISNALDLISSTQGTVFYRGASGWEALTPGTSGQLLSTQGAAANPIWVTATGGAGDMNGPASATDNAIVRFDGTGGKTVQNSAVTIADTTGSISINGTDTATNVNTGGLKSANFGLSTISGGASYFGGAVSMNSAYTDDTLSNFLTGNTSGYATTLGNYVKTAEVRSGTVLKSNGSIHNNFAAGSFGWYVGQGVGDTAYDTYTPLLGITSSGATFAGVVTHTLGTNLPPQTAPASPASGWTLYVDSGDGNKLKAKASTGTVVTIGTP